jgi:hypothetical protein
MYYKNGEPCTSTVNNTTMSVVVNMEEAVAVVIGGGKLKLRVKAIPPLNPANHKKT